MNNRRVTPDCIRELEVNEIFVFGSNLNGYHGGVRFSTIILVIGVNFLTLFPSHASFLVTQRRYILDNIAPVIPIPATATSDTTKVLCTVPSE